jgi:hypothetical protein
MVKVGGAAGLSPRENAAIKKDSSPGKLSSPPHRSSKPNKLTAHS